MLDGDRAAFVRDMAAMPWGTNDPNGLLAAYADALRMGDLAAAEKVLEDPRTPPPGEILGAVAQPMALARARLAWLRGRPDDARRFADEAVAHFQSRRWMPRQEPAVLMSTAFAHAFAGRQTEALRDAAASVAAQEKADIYSGMLLRIDYGQILIVCGRREEALATLRTVTREGTGSRLTAELSFDPIWSLLKDDPRFEETLRSANFR
jgi:hypothetical protein